MSEQACLFLLQDRLKKVRKSRRNWLIIMFVVAIFVGVIWTVYGFSFLTGLFLSLFTGTVGGWVAQNYYGKQEAGILRQIEQMAMVAPKKKKEVET